jgi:two-component system, cell cycle sensor histidine kinase and response regulator CckA
LNLIIEDINKMLPRLIGEDIELVFIPGAKLGRVKADPVQIEQILMNLVANEREAMPKGGRLVIETASVRLDEAYIQEHSIVPPGEYVLLAVTDSGMGIAPEHLLHIFEPFYTTKEEGKGTGLGLATVYGIVKQNSGFIWVYSEPGLGPTFKIYLPQARHAELVLHPTLPLEGCPKGCETLLLAEDEAAVRQSTREFLSLNGYIVLEAANGAEALAPREGVRRTHPFDDHRRGHAPDGWSEAGGGTGIRSAGHESSVRLRLCRSHLPAPRRD